MVTTIQVSSDLRNALAEKKFYDKETFEEVIWDLIEDSMELSEETKKNIKEAEEDIKAGRVLSMEEMKRKLNL
ncbi:MAG: hypothetical protein ABFQ65_04335 [Nanoarchaeota archaeon]